MSISRAFGGATIQKPGAYSQSAVSQNGGVPLAGSNVLFLVGEAALGAPGSVEGYQSFSSAQFPQLVAKYGTGPLVDSAKAALIPSITPGVGGFNQVIVYKTNNSAAATLSLKNSTPSAVLVVTDRAYGVPGNGITVAVVAGTAPTLQSSITVASVAKTEALGQNPAVVQMVIQYVGAGSASVMTIAGASESAKLLTTTCTAASGDNLSIPLAGLTMQQLALQIAQSNGGTKYTCTLSNTLTGTITPATDLDPVTALDIETTPKSLYRIQHELSELINTSTQVKAALASTPVPGNLAVAAATALTGGTLGSSANSDFSTGINGSLSQDYNDALACISQDATIDIAMGVTSPSSVYTIASVAVALNSHLILRGSIKNRKEAQGAMGYRMNTKAAVYAEAQTMNSSLMQLCMQDVLVLDVSGNLTWKQPHVMAAMLMGMRCGTDVGTPLTHKFINAQGIGHFVNPSTGISAGDFDPNLDFDPAISAGVTFCENSGGAFRVVVDNTTYGVDSSFVFNRGSVVNAALYIAKTLRQTAEEIFVGKKISAGTASSLKSVLSTELGLLLTAQIITPTDAFPLGFDPDTFTVLINGNTANVSLLVIPVQGLDFVLISFSLGDITQSA